MDSQHSQSLSVLKQIKSLISEQTGLRLLDNNDASLHKLIQNRMNDLGLNSEYAYFKFLNCFSPSQLIDEHEHLSRGLTTGETYFFRDQAQLDLLKNKILPELIRRNSKQRRLRIWSAGCSSGEEPYSLAILLNELNEDLSDWDVVILATDINPEALTKARQASYRQWSFRQVKADLQSRYFSQEKNIWRLNASIRQAVNFSRFNLVTEDFPSLPQGIHDMDLIVCRNVFIYLESAAVSLVAEKMTATLADSGYLMTGHGELYAHHLGELRTRVFPGSIVYQKHAVTQFTSKKEPILKDEIDNPIKTALPPIISPRTKTQKNTAITKKTATQVLSSSISIQHAWNYANSGEAKQAKSCCEQLIEQNPLDNQPYYLLALLNLEHGTSEDAKTLLKKSIYLAADFIPAYIELGEIYVKENNNLLAKKMWLSAVELLKTLPADKNINMFGDSKVSDILTYVESQINR